MAEWLKGLRIAHWRPTGWIAYAFALAIVLFLDLPWIQEVGLAVLAVVLVGVVAEVTDGFTKPRFLGPMTPSTPHTGRSSSDRHPDRPYRRQRVRFLSRFPVAGDVEARQERGSLVSPSAGSGIGIGSNALELF